MNTGNFVISLDFELHWGVRDKKTIQQYGANIKGVHSVIPRLLKVFGEYKVKATFATVGFLFFETKQALIAATPNSLPDYSNKNLSPYSHFDQVGENYSEDLYHFAPLLIDEIKKYPDHEIGSHTFSHYYCLENGQTVNDFVEDIQAAIEVGKRKNIALTSLVFPRNQFNAEYLKACEALGIICYRGNEHYWFYEAKKDEEESRFRRGLRLLDAYINISGHNCYSKDYLKSNFPVDIPSSRFLRPYSSSLKAFDGLRLHRIKSGMTHAAKNNLTYHLWWHPHNFGIHQNENFAFLEKILRHYEYLNKKYNFRSITMSNLSQELIDEK